MMTAFTFSLFLAIFLGKIYTVIEDAWPKVKLPVNGVELEFTLDTGDVVA